MTVASEFTDSGGDPDSHRRTLWHLALGLASWETVAGADAAIPAHGPWIARIDAVGVHGDVLAGAEASMSAGSSWAIVMGVVDLDPVVLARLARSHLTYLLDPRTGHLVRLPGGNAEVAKQMLGCGWLHPQDVLMLSRDLAMQVEAT